MSTKSEVFKAASDENVVVTELGDSLALLDLRTNQYFSLEGVGALIWANLETPRSRQDIIDLVTAHYEVAEDVCSGDVDAFLKDMLDADLVHTVGVAGNDTDSILAR